MALFKILKGTSDKLPTTYTEGYCYFCTDTNLFYIDTSNLSSGRKILNANDATTLLGKGVETVLSSSDSNLPTSGAVMNYIATIETNIATLQEQVGSMIQLITWEADD